MVKNIKVYGYNITMANGLALPLPKNECKLLAAAPAPSDSVSVEEPSGVVSRLIGEYEEPAPEKGAYTPLKDTRTGTQRRTHEIGATQYETIGAVVRTRTNVKPVFVSVGHKCLLKDAVEITLACAIKYRLPEPTRLAHQLVGRLKLKT